MYFISDELIEELPKPESEDLHSAGPFVDVVVEESAPYFDIEVVSDVRIDSPRPDDKSEEEYHNGVAGLRMAFIERYQRLRKAFGTVAPAHLLVNCGDLIVARANRDERSKQRVQAAFRDVCLPAFRALRGDESLLELLTVAGNEDIYGGGGPMVGDWERSPRDGAYQYYDEFVREFAHNGLPPNPHRYPVASLFRVRKGFVEPHPDEPRRVPLAYLAVVGFDSNELGYDHRLIRDYGQIAAKQLRLSRRLITALRGGVARMAPLYVIAVTHHHLLPAVDRPIHPPLGADDQRLWRFSEQFQQAAEIGCDPAHARLCVTNHLLAEYVTGTTSNAPGFLEHWQQLRASLILQGSMHQRVATGLVRTPLVSGRRAAELHLLAAPAFSPHNADSGMARIRLDLRAAVAEVAYQYDIGPDGRHGRPVQFTVPLISASRVSPQERRLYSKVTDLTAKALKASPDNRSVREFSRHVEATWEHHGYTPLSLPDGTLPDDIGPATRETQYYLLLLLRETGSRNFEMLMSRHSALRPSEVADWDTLLMPAFKTVRELMERLRLDVIRQTIDQALDMEKVSSAKAFQTAVSGILEVEGTQLQGDIWQGKMREIASTYQRKFSPTTGQITRFHYRLVVLTPFVKDWQQTDRDGPQTATDDQKVVDWLSELPSVRLPGAPLTGRRTVPLESLMTGGSGVRWEPAADPDDPEMVPPEDAKRQVALPPGAVWFPLAESDEPDSPWSECPSIVARNADVMNWVDGELARRRLPDGRFPPSLVMGQLAESAGYELAKNATGEQEQPFPFEHDGPPRMTGRTINDGSPLPTSTSDALDRVRYDAKYDLGTQKPYADMEQLRGALVRQWVTVVRPGVSSTRETIVVYDATAAKNGTPLDVFVAEIDPKEELTKVQAGRQSRLLGILRPVQRYVMRPGLARAAEVNAFLEDECHDDPWGFALATYRGAGEPIAITPPIVEQLHRDEMDLTWGPAEFVLCDGNHRVVQKVWNERRVAAAVVILSEPRHPYYARAYSAYEWDVVAANVLDTTPDYRFRYAPRIVDIDDAALSSDARAGLKEIPETERYRRYFRDLSTGFGPIGGQGGRDV